MIINFTEFQIKYGHCDKSILTELVVTYIADPVIGIKDDKEKAMAFLENKTLLLAFCVLCAVIGLASIFANWIVFSYFYTRRKEVVPLIYLSLSSSDLVSGIAAIATATTIGYLATTYTYDNDTILITSYNLASFSIRFSVWNSLVLALVRTINIVKPRYSVRRFGVIATILFFLLLTLATFCAENFAERDISGTDIWHKIRFNFIFSMTGRRMMMYVGRKWCVVFSKEALLALCIIVPFVVPAAIALVAMVIQIYYMRYKTVARRKNSINRHITITILYLTFLYVIVNTLYLVTIVVYLYVVQEMTAVMSFVLFCTCNVVPFLNSLANPIILIVRGRNLRKYTLKVLKCTCKTNKIDPDRPLTEYFKKLSIDIRQSMYGSEPKSRSKTEDVVQSTHFEQSDG